MSQKDNLIIAIQDAAVMENTLVIWLYFTVIVFFVFIVAAFIMRKELKKAITSGNYAPNSQTPKMFRLFMLIFFGASVISGIASGMLVLKVQDIRHSLQEQAIMLETTVNDETQAIIEQEMKQALAISPEEFAQIDREVRQEIDNSKRLLEEEARKRAAKDPSTTVEKELFKLMNQLKGEVDKAQGRIPTPVESNLDKSGQENLNAVVEAIFTEPVKQLEEAEKAKKDNERVVSTQ